VATLMSCPVAINTMHIISKQMSLQVYVNYSTLDYV